MWHLKLGLGISKSHLEYAEMKPSKAIAGLCCPIFEVQGYTFSLFKGNNWKGKNEFWISFVVFFKVGNEYKSQELGYQMLTFAIFWQYLCSDYLSNI